MFKFGKKKGDPNADAPADKSVDADAHGEEAAAAGHGEEKAEEKGGHGKEEKKAEGGGHGAPAEGGEADPALGKISEGPDGVTFYTLPDMVMNIQSADGRPTFLKLKLTLEMHDAEVATHLQSEMPRLQDMFTGFVRELRPEDLSGSAGTYQLRAEILRRVNLVAAPGKVDAVLIEEMLVQ
jgi:flagellar FliL protein